MDIVDDSDDNVSTTSAASDDVTRSDEFSPQNDNEDNYSTGYVTEKRAFSQDQVEYVGVGLLFVSWYLGGGAVSLMNGVVMLVAFGKWIAWRRKQHAVRTIQQLEQEGYLQCRLKLSAVLGSIGAPPLQKSRRIERGNDPIDAPNDFYELVLDYCQAHVDFIHQVDRSLEMLKIETSMSLRASTSSVERVELANLSRNRARSKSVSLFTARRMLSQAMVAQYRSLDSLTVGKSEVNGGGEIPNVVTLAWLRLLRTELASLLSVKVSQLISSPRAFHDDKSTVNDSIFAARESIEYLESIFTLKQPPRQCQAEMDSPDMNLLYRQFEKASVALWAFQVSSMTESISDNTNEADSKLTEFLQHFETLVCSIDDVKERLLNQCESQQKGSSGRLTTEEDTIEDTNINHSVDVRDYEDSGAALSFEGNDPSKYLDYDFGDKTVVFSCSGQETIQKQDKDHNQSEMNIHNQHIALQSKMLQELHHRLEKLEQAEEVDTKGNAIDLEEDAADIPTVRQEEPRIRTTSACLGVSGDVLSELKRTLDVHNDKAEMMTS